MRISVTRGSSDNPGTVRWKASTPANGWGTLSYWCVNSCCDTQLPADGWECSTQGGAAGYCTGECGHDPPHTYCKGGDTPPYLKANVNDERTYPTIWDYAKITCDSTLGCYGIKLPPVTVPEPCGCRRGDPNPPWNLKRIWMHGRKEEDLCPPESELAATEGCIRMHNRDVETLWGFVEVAQGRGAHVHISVPE